MKRGYPLIVIFLYSTKWSGQIYLSLRSVLLSGSNFENDGGRCFREYLSFTRVYP